MHRFFRHFPIQIVVKIPLRFRQGKLRLRIAVGLVDFTEVLELIEILFMCRNVEVIAPDFNQESRMLLAESRVVREVKSYFLRAVFLKEFFDGLFFDVV